MGSVPFHSARESSLVFEADSDLCNQEFLRFIRLPYFDFELTSSCKESS